MWILLQNIILFILVLILLAIVVFLLLSSLFLLGTYNNISDDHLDRPKVNIMELA